MTEKPAIVANGRVGEWLNPIPNRIVANENKSTSVGSSPTASTQSAARGLAK